ncbi:MAG: sulfide/dihydroorotate dehydrogenase-like FAD/NAD-binding protein [Betaproteobacteria bacterium]|nr:sulfide/dihydroorotate dehydrogenase-like FAD/NAD-binding protein [Betaproteobacteria bacterium]MDH3438422.1 sulfide/dihydroorotate dehydrogenase-like FAD/NAD-binding protein [Betaproteobacteria bacterium]
MARIIETRRLTPVTKLFRLDAPLIAASARPGQFVMLRVREGGERIPITIADYHRDAGTLTIVVQEVGATTKRVCALEAGDEILDVAGPMGGHIDIAPGGHVCGVGGGFGSAALLCLMREFTARGDKTTAILGARNKELIILADELKALCHNLEICTDDGSAGFKGFVTQRLAQLIDGDGPGRPDHVVAIGPMAMMRAVADTTRGPKVKTLVSMDPLMVDGTGMCGGCRVNVGGKAQFACVDGPCFDGHEVDFDVAMRRSKAYVKEEKQALDRLTCMANREAR